MKLLLIAIIFAILLICSCTGKAMFKEIETDLAQTQNLTVMGFGTGSSKSPNLAQVKAKNNAFANLAEQLAGREFIYQKSGETVTFKTNTKTTINGSKEVSSIYIGNDKYFTILSAELTRENCTANDSWLLQTEYTTKNLEKSFNEKYQQAVQQIIDKYFKNAIRLEGKLFLTNIDVKYKESSQEFSIKMQVLVLVEG